ncbi:MAG: hypothetical protein IT440_10255, partial [Phycisphaeraceae bacterium]|nr:hypothetical protein [Phycisphaeraceae bacterium]
LAAHDPADAELRRHVAAAILAAVRVAAGRVIDHGFGEHISAGLDLDELESAYLDFVRDVSRHGAPASPAAELHRLMLALAGHDGSAEADMRLVVEGSRVVSTLAGPDSLPGLIAQLNVLVAGRRILPSDVYVREMFRIAEDAAQLHDDDVTQSYLNWVRRLDEALRVPTPLRVASYALNNAATHILEHVHTGELTPAATHMARAHHAIDQMRLRDSGFSLLPVTQLIEQAVAAQIAGHDAPMREYWTRLDEDHALKLLEDLCRYESCDSLVRRISEQAFAAHPALKTKLLHVR